MSANTNPQKFFLALAVTTLCIVQTNMVQADAEEVSEDQKTSRVADELGRGTPQGTTNGFLAAADAGDYTKAAEYLDLRNLRGIAAEMSSDELARSFSVIVNRANWIDADTPSDDVMGHRNDNLPDYRDSIGVVLSGDKEVRLMVQRVPRGDGVFIWKVSNATVSMIPQLYHIYGYPRWIEDLRGIVPDITFLGYELFKWILLLGVAGLVYGSVQLFAVLVEKSANNSGRQMDPELLRFIRLPLSIWLSLILLNASAASLGQSTMAEGIQQLSPLPILITLWILFEATNLLKDIYTKHLLKTDRPGATVFLHPTTNALKLLFTIAAMLVYLDKLGFNITTVLAGLGVGGVAVALALQKPMEDVFGALALFTQQPIRVGDFCRIGSEKGNIEEIGLRTTRLRTLADTVIAIPNGQLVNEPIDNISARKKIRYRPVLRLRYDTSPGQIEKILQVIRIILNTHKQVLEESQRVRFMEIASDALLIEVNCYLNTTDWAMYLEFAEDINLQILNAISVTGASLCAPGMTLYSGQTDQTSANEIRT
jgi:MscS family membrane protein